MSKKSLIILGIISFALVLTVLLISGCAAFSGLKICYEHPEYGHICITLPEGTPKPQDGDLGRLIEESVEVDHH